MDEIKLKEMFAGVVNDVMEKKLADAVGPIAAREAKAIVEKMAIERALFGKDMTGMTDDQKKSFSESIKSVARGMKVKSGELLEEVDSAGGYVVPKEVAGAIVRIAATVGLVLNQATKWPMGTDELGIPAYTGSFLEGNYLAINTAGTITGLTFAQENLIAKKWQLAFALGNDLINDAAVNLTDWLIGLAAEALANRIDKEGFVGTGAPFIGILNTIGVNTQTLGGSSTSGMTTFDKLSIGDASDAIGTIEESMLDGAAFYMNRTVWAKLRAVNTNGVYLFGGMNAQVAVQQKADGLKPAGYILDYPVYTSRHFPTYASSGTTSTAFAVFGNMKAMAYGDRGNMTIAQYQSGSFGGKEIALADQTGLVIKHRHALVLTLQKAFVVLSTSAS